MIAVYYAGQKWSFAGKYVAIIQVCTKRGCVMLLSSMYYILLAFNTHV